MMRVDRELVKKYFPLLTEFVRWFKRRKNELSALPRHLSRRKSQKRDHLINPGKIKVAFICQYIPAWSKNKQLYETLRRDDRFETVLLCVPNRIRANQLSDPDDLTNDVYTYFTEHGYVDAVNALIGENQWYDLRAAHVDYVIYNRYDRPMPIPYTSLQVATHSKVCLILYGTSLLRASDYMLDHAFIANAYCYFAESKTKHDAFLRWNRFLCWLKLSRAECCGIPAVENAYRAMHDDAPAWNFSRNKFRVIYAPRWTTDPVWGGSSFMKYQGFFLEFADRHPEVDLLVRPHPLMFQNFIDTGLMTAEEVAAYDGACSERPNVRLDTEKEYLGTFWQSNALICDFSSMIIEYYVTKKPIIYLTYDEKIEYTDQMNAMLRGCYLVHNESELNETMVMLLSGKDPLAPIRTKVCESELIQGNNLKASENMKQVLLEGYRR